MSETYQSQQPTPSGIVSNAFGERYLFAVNRNAFQDTDASTVFRSYYGESLFEENTFYVIAGTDSGLLYQFIKTHGVPKGSRYLFVEPPPILAQLVDMDDPQAGLAVTNADDWLQRAGEMDVLDYALVNRLVLHRSLGVVHGHYGDYAPFLRKLKQEFDDLIRTQQIGINSRPFTLRQLENLTENQVPAVVLKDSFLGKTAVLLAGGPTLTELLPWVRQHRHNLLVIAVSRISRALLEAGIRPDISVSVDPYPVMLEVSREMLEFQDSTLLVNEYHLCSNLLSSWGGKKAFVGRRYPWPTPLEPENMAQSVGATVTNTAFAIAVETGVAQLVVGGADFCFSQAGYTHASGSADHEVGPRPMYSDTRVETNGGTMAGTTFSFLNSARSFDKQAADALQRGCRVINPAADSIRLPNIEHLSLDTIQIEPLEKPAREILGASLPPDDRNARIRLYKEELGEVDRVLEELRRVKALSNKALDYNRKLFDEGQKGSGFHNNAKLDSIEKQFVGKYADTVKFVKHYGLRRLTPILRQHDQGVKDLEENNRLYFQAFVDTANELMEILHGARNRILSRLEEEKSQPNVLRLIEQWRRDQQPGRAIQWAKQHADYVSQLPEAQRQALREFEATFETTLAELNEQNLNRIANEGVKLDGLNGRAREYFLCRDEEGLLSLLAGLQEYRDTEQAKPFIPLVKGYLAELHGDAAAAIETYQQIKDGPAHMDALMRRFELLTKNQNLESALQVLKVLSDISSVYTPMYADLLQATGDIDSAVNIYTDYLLANPDDLNSMMKLGKIFHQYGSAEGVEWTMNYILGKDPGNQAARAMLNSLDSSQASG